MMEKFNWRIPLLFALIGGAIQSTAITVFPLLFIPVAVNNDVAFLTAFAVNMASGIVSAALCGMAIELLQCQRNVRGVLTATLIGCAVSALSGTVYPSAALPLLVCAGCLSALVLSLCILPEARPQSDTELHIPSFRQPADTLHIPPFPTKHSATRTVSADISRQPARHVRQHRRKNQQRTKSDKARFDWRIPFIFAFLGGPLAGLPAAIITHFLQANHFLPDRQTWHLPVLISAVLGFIPFFLTGCIAVCARWQHSRRGIVNTALTGAAVATLFVSIFLFPVGGFILSVFTIPSGAFASLVLAWMLLPQPKPTDLQLKRKI